MFVVNVIYTAPLAEIDKLLVSHRAWLDLSYQRGIFLCSGPQIPRQGGIIIAANINKLELEQLLAQDPFAQHGVARYQITEFEVVKSHPLLQAYLAAN